MLHITLPFTKLPYAVYLFNRFNTYSVLDYVKKNSVIKFALAQLRMTTILLKHLILREIKCVPYYEENDSLKRNNSIELKNYFIHLIEHLKMCHAIY